MVRSLVLLLLPSLALAQSRPPVAPVRAVTALYQGVTVTDPYRYLELLSNPDVLKWIGAQGDFTRKTLDRIPALAGLRKRVEELDASMAVRIAGMQRTSSGAFFYTARKGDEPLAKLYVRPSLDGRERLLFDPDEGLKHGGKREAINHFNASPDGKWVLLLTAPADSEVGALRLREVATGKDVGATISGIWGELGPVWRPDGKAFFYTRAAPPGQPIDEKTIFTKQRIFLHPLDGGSDVQVFGWEAPGAPASRAADWPFVVLTAGSPYALAQLSEGVNGLPRLYVAERDRVGKDARWTQVVDEKQEVRDFALGGHWLYVKTYAGAPRFRVLRYDLRAPTKPPVEVVPQQKGVVDALACAADAMYFVVRDNATSELYRMPHGTSKIEKIAMPWVGSLDLSDTSPALPGVIVRLFAWTRTEQIFTVAADGKVANTNLIPVGPFGSGEDLVAEERTCKGWDGAAVPMSIIGKKGFARDGKNPTLIYGYGGYGVTDTAYFNPTWRAFLELGGLLARVNPRGSGAYGEEWYQAGRGAKKANTWKDMISCAETLVGEKYTSPAMLAIQGVSMGGVAVGRAVTERPDLFGAALMQVGILDAIRFIEASFNGPNHELEMGTLKSADGVKALLEMSAYHHVKDGVKYPAVMVVQGLNDHRVPPWCSFKMTARLQAATASGKPVLLRTDTEGGHGVTSTAQQRDAQWADWIAFHLWTVGRPEFQPH
jgi:prolyl oligopeptidase